MSEARTSVRLHVQDAQGRRQWLDFAAVSEAEAVRRATSAGQRVLALESLAAGQTRAARGTGFPLLLFSQELLALLEAGLNLTEAMVTLQRKERQPMVAAVLAELLRQMREGRNFSDVLALSPQHFPDVYVASVRASERTGDLPQALARYIAYQLQFDELRKKLVSTLIYPIMLVVVGSFVTLFLLGYVVPRFAIVYESSGRVPPGLSGVLLMLGTWIHAHWLLTALILLILFAALAATVLHAATRAAVFARILSLPWIAARANEFRLARFFRALSLLLSAGVPLARAMGMVAGLLGPAQRQRLAEARLAVEQGHSFSTALLAAELASPVAESLIKVGERSGQMAEMLERTARFSDEDFARWLDWSSRLLEPVLMLAIGLVIGTVVVLMYLPIFELAGSLR